MTEVEFKAMFMAFNNSRMTNGLKPARVEDWRPVYNEDKPMHEYDWHYILHTGWAARWLMQTRPKQHADFASSLYFISIASAICSIESYDIRKVIIPLPGLGTNQGDLTALNIPSGSIESASCLHVIEHIGLARYGDQLDALGDQKAANELSRILAPGAQLLIATPVGKPRVMFNAHRIYSPIEVKQLFSGLYLDEFSLIGNDGSFRRVPNETQEVNDSSPWGACGCFRFLKS